MESVWNDFDLPAFRPLSGDTKTDVLVIGGGMAGLLCAHTLRRAGVHCIVAEAAQIGRGITKNTTAKVTAQHGLIYHKLIKTFGAETAQLYLRANADAVSDLRKLSENAACDWQDRKNFIYSLSDRAVLETELEALHSLHCRAELEENLALPFPTAGAVVFEEQGQFHPLKFLKHISEPLLIYENTPVRELTPYAAITDYGRIFADAFIVATHFPFLNKHGSYFLKLYQQRSYVLALENALAPGGMYLSAEENGLSFRHCGDILLLGGSGHRTGKPGGGWTELEEKAKAFYPKSKVIRRWATQDCMSLDGIPYIGQYSRNTPNLYVATGFNKWGMTSSMVAANILTDLVQRKPNVYAQIFSPSRSILYGQLGINLLESTKNLLSPTSPRCPHLGCALRWNKQEHSWDCPCHGSRFEENGKLIDNPATGDLKKRK